MRNIKQEKENERLLNKYGIKFVQGGDFRIAFISGLRQADRFWKKKFSNMLRKFGDEQKEWWVYEELRKLKKEKMK